MGLFRAVRFRLCYAANPTGTRDRIAMSEDFHNKNVGLVAGIIGGSVLLLGLGGLFLHLL